MSALNFDARIHSDKLKQDIAEIDKNLKGATSNIEREGKKIDQSMQGASKSIGDIGGSFKELKNIILPLTGAGGAFAMIGVGIKRIIDTSDTLQTKWAEVITGMKYGTDQFFRTLATGDFSNFFDNIRRAIDLGKEYERVIDELQELHRAYTLQEAERIPDLVETLEAARNINLTSEERKKNIDKHIKLQEELADMRVKMAEKEYNLAVDRASHETKLNKETLFTVMKDFDSSMKTRAQAYNELKEVEAGYYNWQLSMQARMQTDEKFIRPETEKEIQDLKNQIGEVTDGLIIYAGEYARLGDTIDEVLDNVANSTKKLTQEQVSSITETQRVRRRMYAVEADLRKQEEEDMQRIKVASDSAMEAMNKIADLRRRLGSGTIEQDIQLELEIANQQEIIDSWQELVAEGVKKAIERIPIVMPEISSIQVGSKGVENKEKELRISSDITKELAKQLDPMKIISKEQAEQLLRWAEIQDQINELIDVLPGISDILGSISYAVGQVDADLGRLIGGMADVAYNALLMVKGINTGDIAGAVSSGIAILGNIIGMVKKTKDEFRALTDAINSSKESLTRREWFKQTDFQIRQLKNGIQEMVDAWDQFGMVEAGRISPMELVLNRFTAIYDTMGRLPEKYKKQLEDHVAQINEYNRLMEETFAKITGTSSDAIADAIIEGFRQGKRSAKDFADDFENLMEKAVVESFRALILQGALKSWIEQFSEVARGGLTEAEIDRQRLLWREMMESNIELLKIVEDVSGIDFSGLGGAEGLVGAIRGMSEETAGMIAGRLMAQNEISRNHYLTAQEQLDVINQSVSILGRIESNTRHNVKLNDIDDRLKQMNLYLERAI